ncbi:MAG: cytochrome c family protein [Pseudomonadota bacterium]
MTSRSAFEALFAPRWVRDLQSWRFIFLAYVPTLAALSLAWEVAQLPLYTLWASALPEIAFAVAHCTGGDVLIGLSALFTALLLTRAGALPQWRWPWVTAVAVTAGTGYTVYSEWLNTAVRKSWAYSELMPVVPHLEVGLSPLAQWLVVPAASLWIARRLFLGNRIQPAGSSVAKEERRNTMNTLWLPAALSLALLGTAVPADADAAGDPARGAQAFRACAACHSIEPGQHLTGPSLADVFGRKAATVEGFQRYSKALKDSGVVWDEKTLDVWLQDPAKLIPGNLMTFRGIPDARVRADLIAYLKAASEGKAASAPTGRGGMMQAPRLADLKKADPESLVKEIRYCRDTYHVTTADGETFPFWEFNLRFKTDSSDRGPRKGQPVLFGAGMMGDRAFVVFSDPAEISAFVKNQCP